MKELIFQLFFFLLIFPFVAFSQVKVSGKVSDKVEPVAYANVILLDSDGNMAAGAVTDETGKFELEVALGNYVLKVSYIGYKNWESQVSIDGAKSFNDIILEEDSGILDEIVVVAKTQTVERRVDRLVFNVENNAAVSGGDALDALKVSPGVIIQNNQIKMIGKNEMKVMIDGRLMTLSGDELNDFLRTIPADDIKRIEVITNPPAKYEASGNSGLINIVYKKGVRDSWNNSTSISYAQAAYPYYFLRNTFTFNKKRIKFLMNLSGRFGEYEEIENLEVFYPEGLWDTELKRVEELDYVSGRVSLDYDLGRRTSIGFQYLGTFMKPDMKDNSVTRIYNGSNSIQTFLKTNGYTEARLGNNALNIHFTTKFDSLGKKLSIDLDYFDYDSEQDRNFKTNRLSGNNEFLNLVTSANNTISQTIENYNARIDLEHPTKVVNLSYGGSLSFSNNINSPRYFNIQNEIPIEDKQLSDDYQYEEKTGAAYINASRNITEQLQTQVGLRYEHTDTKGISRTLNRTIRNSYWKLFPTFYLSYFRNDTHSFSFNYGKRINRPNYAFLNPFRFYINSNMYSEGNPFLQPSFNDNFEFSHTYKNNLITNFYVSITSDGFGPVSSVNMNTNEQVITRENFYNQQNYGITEIYSFNAIPWWESQNTLNVSYSKSEIYNAEVDALAQNGFGFYASSNNTFILNKSKTIKGQVNTWYNSASKTLFYENSDAFSLDLALKYSLLNNSLQTTVGVYDIFNTSPVKQTYFVNDVKQTYQMFSSNRYFRVALTYKFGNKKVNVKQRSFGNEEEKGRAGF